MHSVTYSQRSHKKNHRITIQPPSPTTSYYYRTCSQLLSTYLLKFQTSYLLHKQEVSDILQQYVSTHFILVDIKETAATPSFLCFRFSSPSVLPCTTIHLSTLSRNHSSHYYNTQQPLPRWVATRPSRRMPTTIPTCEVFRTNKRRDPTKPRKDQVRKINYIFC